MDTKQQALEQLRRRSEQARINALNSIRFLTQDESSLRIAGYKTLEEGVRDILKKLDRDLMRFDKQYTDLYPD